MSSNLITTKLRPQSHWTKTYGNHRFIRIRTRNYHWTKGPNDPSSLLHYVQFESPVTDRNLLVRFSVIIPI